MTYTKKMIEQLVYYFGEYRESSNFRKILKILEKQLQDLEKVFEDIKKVRDIDQAEGIYLDRIGININLPRFNKTDEEYRKLLKTEIVANLSDGELPRLNDVLTNILEENFEGIEETWNNELFNNEPAGLTVNIKGGNIETVDNLIGRIKAGGIGVHYSLNYKQTESDFYIGSILLSGEKVEVYPWTPIELYSKGKVYIPTVNGTNLETATIYPRKEVI